LAECDHSIATSISQVRKSSKHANSSRSHERAMLRCLRASERVSQSHSIHLYNIYNEEKSSVD
jgi:hypothetical protein